MRPRVTLALPLVPLAVAACGAHHDAPAPDPLDNPTASPMRATYDGYTVGVRPTTDGFVYATNHFVSDATKGMDLQPPAAHSTLRWERLGQLVPPAATATKYGAFELASLVGVLRDRVNAETGAVSDASYFDDGQTLATDGALYEAVFDPSRLQVWVAAGGIPVPTQRFVGFSLARLLAQGAPPPSPATVE